MDKNFLKGHNIKIKRRSHIAVDPNEFISDLLEHKIHENQLINNCLSGLIPEKARPLVWAIFLNLIPFDKPNEWLLHFKRLSEFYKSKIHKCLKIKENNQVYEYDYEAINKNLRLVNNENIKKSNFTNVNFNANFKISNLISKANINDDIDKVIVNKEKNINNINNKIDIIIEKIESEENKNLDVVDKNELIISAERIKLININSDSYNNFSLLKEKTEIELSNKEVNFQTQAHCGKIISGAYKKENKQDFPNFELIPKKQKIDKFYLFYPKDEKFSIEKISEENFEISEASRIIKLDIDRTFQEMDLFKTTETKEILCKTLFIWYCENSDLGYKQGMNEILATIFYAAFNINEPIFEKIPNLYEEKENKHKEFLNLIESDEFFQMISFSLFDQIFALGLKSIYNYHNFADAKEFCYTEEKSNFDFIKEEKFEILHQKENKNCKNYKEKFGNENSNDNNEIESDDYTYTNGILEKSDFELINKFGKTDKNENHKFFNLENISTFLLNKKERAKNNINDSFKSLKDFILKRPWDFKKSAKTQKNKYKQDEKNNKKIDYKIFESENMDTYNVEEIVNLEQSDLRRRINIIFFYYLKSYDPELYNHLLHKIDPYIIIFRWIICLFNREISLNYVLYIWDCVFAIEFLEKNSLAFCKSFKSKPYRNVINNLNFVNFICVSIFEDMRKELLLEEEACFVLQMLMHFPNEKNVKEIVKRALKIRNFIYEKLQIKNEFVFID
jgi:hypothetical protein